MSHQAPEADKRAYWTAQMDEAFAFMERMRSYPVEECGEEVASLVEASEGLEVVFSDSKINHHYPRVYAVRQGLIPSFQAVAREINERGWILKVEDGYRSPEMQRAQSHNPVHFDVILAKTIWELNGSLPDPAMMLRRMSAMIATRCKIGTHISASAIDISVFDRATGQELDRGGRSVTYVELSERTPMTSPFITSEQRENREQIESIFRKHGWIAYPYEFWHFSQGDCYVEALTNPGRPAKYGPVRYDGGKITPILHPESDELLEPVEFYEKQIAAALQRIGSERK